jgi:hypothetical protein
MSPGESPPIDDPSVDDDEELYRAIMHPNWWKPEEQRISSAAFKQEPTFSVDIASIAGSPEKTLERFWVGTGLASFPCREARKLGCSVRKERDPQHPDNDAHAHVYMPADEKDRMRAAKKLALVCKTLRAPDLDLLRWR